MSFYSLRKATELNKAVGKDLSNGCRISTKTAGHICFGSDISLPKGTYFAGFYIFLEAYFGEEESIVLDVFSNTLKRCLSERRMRSGDLLLNASTLFGQTFAIEERINDLEARLWIPATAGLQVETLLIFSRPPGFVSRP